LGGQEIKRKDWRDPSNPTLVPHPSCQTIDAISPSYPIPTLLSIPLPIPPNKQSVTSLHSQGNKTNQKPGKDQQNSCYPPER